MVELDPVSHSGPALGKVSIACRDCCLLCEQHYLWSSKNRNITATYEECGVRLSDDEGSGSGESGLEGHALTIRTAAALSTLWPIVLIPTWAWQSVE